MGKRMAGFVELRPLPAVLTLSVCQPLLCVHQLQVLHQLQVVLWLLTSLLQ